MTPTSGWHAGASAIGHAVPLTRSAGSRVSPHPCDRHPLVHAVQREEAPAVEPVADARPASTEVRPERPRRWVLLAGGVVLVAAVAIGVTTAGGGPPPAQDTLEATGLGRLTPPGGANPPGGADAPGASEVTVDVGAAQLDPEDLEGPLPRGWLPRFRTSVPFDPLPSACAGRPDPQLSSLGFLEGRDRVQVGHVVASYGDAAAAERAFGRIVESVERCERTGAAQLVPAEGSSERRFYARFTAEGARHDVAVQRNGRTISAVALRNGTLRELTEIADLAAVEVVCAANACGPPR